MRDAEPKRGRPKKYPFGLMAVGQHFDAPRSANHHGSLGQMAWKYGKRYGHSYSLRTLAVGLVRVTRTA